MAKNKLAGFSSSFFLFLTCRAPVGGQAVLNGVMLRSGDYYGLAVRGADGSIWAQRLPWLALIRAPWTRWPFARGFPALLETVINGINALNRSVALADRSATPASGRLFSVAAAALVAMALFMWAPHALAAAMAWLNLGGDASGFAFHLWDGFYKCVIFICYIYFISFFPDIRVFYQYHGAEHKIISAFEEGDPVSARAAARGSRLHPRCGTTFLLYVIFVSIIAQALFIPLALKVWTPENAIVRHLVAAAWKLFLIAPVSALAYELIGFASGLRRGWLAFFLLAPGLALQLLTTREPTPEQLDVAAAALKEALGPGDDYDVQPAPYSRIAAPGRED